MEIKARRGVGPISVPKVLHVVDWKRWAGHRSCWK